MNMIMKIEKIFYLSVLVLPIKHVLVISKISAVKIAHANKNIIDSNF